MAWPGVFLKIRDFLRCLVSSPPYDWTKKRYSTVWNGCRWYHRWSMGMNSLAVLYTFSRKSHKIFVSKDDQVRPRCLSACSSLILPHSFDMLSALFARWIWSWILHLHVQSLGHVLFRHSSTWNTPVVVIKPSVQNLHVRPLLEIQKPHHAMVRFRIWTFLEQWLMGCSARLWVPSFMCEKSLAISLHTKANIGMYLPRYCFLSLHLNRELTLFQNRYEWNACLHWSILLKQRQWNSMFVVSRKDWHLYTLIAMIERTEGIAKEDRMFAPSADMSLWWLFHFVSLSFLASAIAWYKYLLNSCLDSYPS